MIYKIGLLGASGRMGREVAELLCEGFTHRGNRLELADAIAGSQKLRSLEGVEVRRFDDGPREPVHAWVDFSRPEATMKLLQEIKTPVVIGTTGFSTDERMAILEYSERHPVLLAPNTSPGMSLVQAWLRALIPPPDLYPHCVLQEEHHAGKKDAPSGTAKACLEILKDQGYPEVAVQVTRAGAIVGNHTIRFIADDEEVEITHRAFNRKVFARGALLGVEFLLGTQKPRVYEMKEVWEKS